MAEIQVQIEALLSIKSYENKIMCIFLPNKTNWVFICSLRIQLSDVLRALKHPFESAAHQIHMAKACQVL